MKNIIVIGNPSIGDDIAIYLAEHNIPFIDIADMGEKPDLENALVIVIPPDTKSSDLIRVIEIEKNNTTMLTSNLPSFEDTIYSPSIKEINKPFYDGVYSKGGKKRGKKFGR